LRKLVRLTDQVFIVEQLLTAETYFSRLRGLIGKKEFHFGEGLLFPNCKSIHMWMMSIPIDVVFLKLGKSFNERVVTSIHRDLQPWKISPVSDLSANDVLELPAGTVEKKSIQVGEVLCIV
jgi:uncharacterized membrane protein (UPF0127 family)